VAQLTVILELQERRFGHIASDVPDTIQRKDWYAIYLNNGPAAEPCWYWTGMDWTEQRP
jgi:hypothetical protein